MGERRVNLGIWDKLTKAVVFLLILAAMVAVAVWYLPLIKQNERMRQEILRLEGEIIKEEELSRRNKASIEALRNDPKTVARYARETLGLAESLDTVFRFVKPNSEGQ